MHKKALKRNTLHTLTQRTKVPENSSRSRNYEDNEDESNDHFQLPSLQTKKVWKDVDDRVSAWDGNSATTCMSYSSEMENIATCKVMQQWELIENTLYEDGEQVNESQNAILEECVQWRTQIPHLRVIGKNPFLSKSKYHDLSRSSSQAKHSFDSSNEEIFSEHVSTKVEKNSHKNKSEKMPDDKILDMLFDYVMSELFPNKANETDSADNDLSEILQIQKASIHSNKSSAKSMKINFEETISLENRFPSNKDRTIESHIVPLRKEIAQTNMQDIQNKDKDTIKSERDAISAIEDKLFRPHTGRNKLGTVFNEKIVVSPVPYILSTRESFSTVKTTPIKYMGQSLNVSTFQGSSRSISYSGKYSSSAKNSGHQSAWHAPVSPAVWPKNIKLAPLETSRLPSSRNRSVTSSSVPLHRSRKPLSPIPRSIMPVSAQTSHNINGEGLEIQGRHIFPGQSCKQSVSSTGWDYNVGNGKIRKKKSQSKLKS
ncbi:uncharacterized protein LOC143186557 isoform X2 [Calliopsis andreniformis]|uniref:uncharacterized protein LOC143186557 isoform X2 n=1 Tax=Calliopsis andreniformis TaxID=337506 RepID=UPI003FCED198